MKQITHRILIIFAVACCGASLMLAPSGAARSVNDREKAAEAGKLEGRMTGLQRRAERAEAEAAWHEQRAEEWAEIAARQNSLGDFAVGREPLAEFNADTHRRQRERKLQRAMQLRRELSRLLHERRTVKSPATGSNN